MKLYICSSIPWIVSNMFMLFLYAEKQFQIAKALLPHSPTDIVCILWSSFLTLNGLPALLKPITFWKDFMS